jgi:Leucine-rich repeat (LRR) protein
LISACISKYDDRETPEKYTELNSVSAFQDEPVVSNAEADEPIVIGGYAYRNYTKQRIGRGTFFVIGVGYEENDSKDLNGIEQLKNARSLWITSSIENIDMSPLQSLVLLESLRIAGNFTKIPDLSGIPSLTHLEIAFANLASLDGIEKIPSLERLEVQGNRQPLTDTSALRQAKNLKYLQFFDDAYAVKMSDLFGLTALEVLRTAVYREHDLTGIGALQSLKRLSVEGTIPERTNERNPFEEIGELAGLTELYLDAPLPSVDFLANNVNLEKLTLIADSEREDFFDKVLVVDLTPLMNLKKLKYLHIQGFVGSLDRDELPELEYFHFGLHDYE